MSAGRYTVFSPGGTTGPPCRTWTSRCSSEREHLPESTTAHLMMMMMKNNASCSLTYKVIASLPLLKNILTLTLIKMLNKSAN
ncbi:hypothetical protein FQN60_015377, partial [Etheostoma spectabile]